MRYIGFILALFVAMSSCDTREDWFEKNSEFPDVVVDINGQIDTIRQGDLRKIVVDLRTCRNNRGALYTDTSNVMIKGISDKGVYPMDGINLEGVTIKGGRNYTLGENNEMYMDLYDVFAFFDYVLFKSDTAAFLLETYNGHCTMFDKFGNDQSYSIEVNVYGPIPPTPVLKVGKLNDDYEYMLSLEDSYDRDGKVQKYEWCVDGNVVSYSVQDCRLDDVEGAWQSGQAAYGGTYVTATELSSINHSFQTSGEHTVYYRCMDDMGIWSMWYSQKISVEE